MLLAVLLLSLPSPPACWLTSGCSSGRAARHLHQGLGALLLAGGQAALCPGCVV